MQWYGDNSELNGIWNAELPDILLFGGIGIRKDAIPSLIRTILRVKSRYAEDPHFPIKYNMRDLRQWYEERNLGVLYERLLSESGEWRRMLIEQSLACDFGIIIACANIFGPRAEHIRESKQLVTQFCFADALQRVALLAREYCATTCDVILDWPDSNRHTPYTREYRSAYTSGCCDGFPDNQYYAGPLRDLGFSDGPFFARMEDCALLQFSDIVVGATREFVEFALERKPERCLGVQLMKLLIPKFRGYPNRIVGRGISISPSGGTLRHRVFRAMVQLRYGTGQPL